MKAFVIDLAKCNGCYNCQIACKEEHVGNDWMPYAKPQPDTGQFWMRMHEKVRGSVPKVKVSYVATPCMHCPDARCIAACGPTAIYRREDGLVVIDPVEDECLEDVRVTLTSVATPARKKTEGADYCFRGDHGGQPKTGVTLVSTTDDFGDFWFNQTDTAQYVLKIEKEGYVTRTIAHPCTYRCPAGQRHRLYSFRVEPLPALRQAPACRCDNPHRVPLLLRVPLRRSVRCRKACWNGLLPAILRRHCVDHDTGQGTQICLASRGPWKWRKHRPEPVRVFSGVPQPIRYVPLRIYADY
jgi:ferredoxin-like protein FixX